MKENIMVYQQWGQLMSDRTNFVHQKSIKGQIDTNYLASMYSLRFLKEVIFIENPESKKKKKGKLNSLKPLMHSRK